MTFQNSFRLPGLWVEVITEGKKVSAHSIRQSIIIFLIELKPGNKRDKTSLVRWLHQSHCCNIICFIKIVSCIYYIFLFTCEVRQSRLLIKKKTKQIMAFKPTLRKWKLEICYGLISLCRSTIIFSFKFRFFSCFQKCEKIVGLWLLQCFLHS